jgi:hypothetical protein
VNDTRHPWHEMCYTGGRLPGPPGRDIPPTNPLHCQEPPSADQCSGLELCVRFRYTCQRIQTHAQSKSNSPRRFQLNGTPATCATLNLADLALWKIAQLR